MRRQRFFLILLILGLAGSVLPARGATPSLLLDIDPSGPVSAGAISGRFLPLGRVALAPASDLASGSEVWVTDGTDAGTRPLLDTCPGSCVAEIDLLGALGKVGVFQLNPSFNEAQLWRSDGTSPGTFLLTHFADGGPERCSFSPEPARAAVAGSTLFFSGRTQGGCELWKTNGTVAGTQRLREITPAGRDVHTLHDLTAVGQRVFFLAEDAAGWGLWRSDGTPAGTIRLRSWRASAKPQSLVAAGSRLFFVAERERQGLELWTSDGTAAGTRALTGFTPANPGFLLQQTGGSLYFVANDGRTGREMWSTDGTAAGTRPVTRFAVIDPFSVPWRVEKLGGRLIFSADDGQNGPRLWTTDGRPASTAPLDRCSGACPLLPPDLEMVRVGTQIFFSAASEPGCLPDGPVATDLWVSDGTGAGTRRVQDFCPCCRVARLSPLLGKVFFAAGPLSTGYDWWASDGTEPGTRELVSVKAQDLPIPPAAVNGRALLAAAGPDAETPDLWASDGTPAGTEALAFIGRNGRGAFPQGFVPTPEGARFIARNAQDIFQVWESRGTAATTNVLDGELPGRLAALGPLTLGWGPLGVWRTDGTPAGNFRLTPEDARNVGQLVVVGNRALFTLSRESGNFLWATDGTLAGTQEIIPVPEVTTILPAGTSALVNGFSSRRVWLTDGTAAGTREIPLPQDFVMIDGIEAAPVGSAFFFQATSSRGPELWRTDGTAAGTHPFAEETVQQPHEFIAHRGALYFAAQPRDGSFGAGLWRSDGTEAGMVLLRSFPSLALARFTSLGDVLYFTARQDDGVELWRTDGTSAGTAQVRDISPGELSSHPSDLTPLGGKLYFVAHLEEYGRELWESDGTEEGTRLVQDIAPGAYSTSPLELTAGGDGRLYFAADDAVHGYEPWVYAPGGGAGCVPSDRVLCLRGGRFKVEASWRVPSGLSGPGRAVSLTPDTGYFWFFDPANVEVILKVLDGQGLNGHHWVFYGALSNVEYALTVTDTQTGAARRYTNMPGRLGSVADTQAFGPLGASAPGVVTAGPAPEVGEALIASRTTAATGSCTPGATRLCLQGGRFAVEASWKDFQGQTGTGKAVPLAGGDTGYFWFFDASNVEVVLKVLDGRLLNDRFWVFYGALSNVEYTLTVTDTETGAVKTYTNPSGRLGSVADTGAFEN